MNIGLLGQTSYTNDNNDIWGYTDSTTGKEYALVGTTAGVSIVDISSATPQKKQFIQKLLTLVVILSSSRIKKV